MLKTGTVFCRYLKNSDCIRSVHLRRTFLSEAYRCREAWEKRLESPVLRKVNTRSLFQDLDAQFSHFGRASALDVDIFVNACTRSSYIEDVETIITLLRLCPDSEFTLPSTHHGIVRLLLDADRDDTLLKIISDRLKYGIFPDHYCCNLLMDTFLKAKKFAAAARVGVSQMLQEDWENVLTTRLSIYSCHMYLRNHNQPWYLDEEIITPPPEPKELVKVRVKYIRQPYFDDHFDLKDPSLLVGKTLAMFSSKFGGTEMLSNSYLLTGLTLYQKWDKVNQLVQSLSSSKKTVFKEAVQLARNSLQSLPHAMEEKAETDSTKQLTSQQGKENKTANIDGETIQRVDNALQALETYASDGDMVQEMEKLVKEAVAQQESQMIEEQVKLYSKWEEDRVTLLKEQLEEIQKEETLKKIEEQKSQLLAEEREIFFFENEDKLDMLIEEREEMLAQTVELKEKKLSAKAEREKADAAYIPPEAIKRQSS